VTIPEMTRQSGWVIGLALVLMIAGLVADLGFVHPQLKEYRSLNAERLRLRDRLVDIESQREAFRQLSGYLDAGGPDAGGGESRLPDPVDYLAEGIQFAKLWRLELRTGVVGASDGFLRSRIFLRAKGSYAQIVDFISWLEKGKRLVAVDALSIQPIIDSRDLELRINVSIYDHIEE
jgi:hypothetical protein